MLLSKFSNPTNNIFLNCKEITKIMLKTSDFVQIDLFILA